MWHEMAISNGLLKSILEIHDYFKYITKNHETAANSPPIWIYINQIKTIHY